MSRLVLTVVAATLFGCGVTDPGDDAEMRPPMTNGVSTLAGWSNSGYVDGDRMVNLFHNPVTVAFGPDGQLYVADFDNNLIRRVDMEGGTTTIVSQPGFSRPFAMLFVGSTLWVNTDFTPTGGHGGMGGTIWRVDVSAKKATAVAVGIGRPRGIAALSDGRLALADYEHHVIELMDPATGAVTPLAGSWDVKGAADGVGAAATFSTPYSLVQVAGGKLLVTDFDNHALRFVGLDGTVTTAAGGSAGFADGALAAAKFKHPQGLVKDAAGTLYVTDLDNFRVRRISSDLMRVDTIAGDGSGGYADDDNPLAAKFYGLEGLGVKPDGSMVFVADGTRGTDVTYNRVRSVNLKP